MVKYHLGDEILNLVLPGLVVKCKHNPFVFDPSPILVIRIRISISIRIRISISISIRIWDIQLSSSFQVKYLATLCLQLLKQPACF